MSIFNSAAMVTTLCLAGLAPAGAADPSVEIELIVVDTDDRPLQGTTVVLYRLEPETGVSTRVAHTASDEKGEAGFEDLPPARYLIRADLTGFLDTEIGPLPLAAEDIRSHRVPKLVVVLNEVTVF